jgi:hypothetical protein
MNPFQSIIEFPTLSRAPVANLDRPITLRLTGSKKQSDEERGAALFAVRVHAIVRHDWIFPTF